MRIVNQKILALYRFAAHLVLGRNYPLGIYWKITYRCNANCLYCGVGSCKDTEELPPAELRALVEEACTAGLYRISLSGGEPLLRQDVGELIRLLKRRGVSVAVDTNGALVEEHLADLRLVEQVNLSVDGEQQIHDAQRGPGSFAKAMRAAELLRTAGVATAFACVITPGNFRHLEEVLRMARHYGVKVNFQPATQRKHASKERNPQAPTTEQLRSAMAFLAGNRSYSRNIANPSLYFRMFRDYPRIKSMPCPGGRLACIVNPDGKLGSCDNNLPGHVWRDARAGGFESAFAGLVRFPPCNQCTCASAVLLQLAMRLEAASLFDIWRSC